MKSKRHKEADTSKCEKCEKCDSCDDKCKDCKTAEAAKDPAARPHTFQGTTEIPHELVDQIRNRLHELGLNPDKIVPRHLEPQKMVEEISRALDASGIDLGKLAADFHQALESGLSSQADTERLTRELQKQVREMRAAMEAMQKRVQERRAEREGRRAEQPAP